MCLRSVITQRSKTDFGRFVGESRARERGLGVILCTCIPILRRRYVEGISLDNVFCVVYVILDEISKKSGSIPTRMCARSQLRKRYL